MPVTPGVNTLKFGENLMLAWKKLINQCGYVKNVIEMYVQGLQTSQRRLDIPWLGVQYHFTLLLWSIFDRTTV